VVLRRGLWALRFGIAVVLRHGLRSLRVGIVVVLRRGIRAPHLDTESMVLISFASEVWTLHLTTCLQWFLNSLHWGPSTIFKILYFSVQVCSITARPTREFCKGIAGPVGLEVNCTVNRYMKPVDRELGSGKLSWFQVFIFWIEFQSKLGFLLLVIPLAI